MATEIRKPTTFTEGVLALWTNESNCYDTATGGDETTYGYGNIGIDEFPSIRFHTWQTKGYTYTATVLKVKWRTSIQTGDDEFGIEYTDDGGSNWYDLLAMGINRSIGYTTAQVSLNANQDLTLVEVRFNHSKYKGSDGCNVEVSDIWTEGEYTAGGAYYQTCELTISATPSKSKSSTGKKISLTINGTPAMSRLASLHRMIQLSVSCTPTMSRLASLHRTIQLVISTTTSCVAKIVGGVIPQLCKLTISTAPTVKKGIGKNISLVMSANTSLFKKVGKLIKLTVDTKPTVPSVRRIAHQLCKIIFNTGTSGGGGHPVIGGSHVISTE